MERKSFSQILKEASVDLRREYDRLYSMFCLQKYPNGTGEFVTLKEFCGYNFINLPFRGTCISLDDFDDFYGYHFQRNPKDLDLNYLVSFCEYSYNLALYNQGIMFGMPVVNSNQPMPVYLQQVIKVIEIIGYMINSQNGVVDFVPKDQAAIAVAEIIDPNLSYKLIEYNHHTMKGNLVRKKETLLALADKLEPQRAKLCQINKTLESDLFFLFNNVNLRHNNADPNGKAFHSYIEKMGAEDIERWYDEIYQMCLLAFLELDNVNRKESVKKLKKDIDT